MALMAYRQWHLLHDGDAIIHFQSSTLLHLIYCITNRISINQETPNFQETLY